MNAHVYYEVQGQRPIFNEEKDGTVVRVGHTPDKYVRFASVSQAEANAYATDIYKYESIVCEVFEIDRATQKGRAA